MNILLIDTESTARRGGQVCQLAWLALADNSLSPGNLYFTVDTMDPGAEAVHGLSPETLARLSGGNRFSDCAGTIHTLLSGADLVVGHNVSADLRSLREEFDRLSMPLPVRKSFCTMNHFTPVTRLKRVYHTNRFKPPKLSELAAHYDLTPEFISAQTHSLFGESCSCHDARFDVCAVYLSLRQAARAGDLDVLAPHFA